jgi:hypothetical protein
LLIILTACSTNRFSYCESEQLNFPPLLNSKPFQAPIRPDNTITVKAEVLEVRTYKGGFYSYNTWPHKHLTLKILNGTLPSKPTLKSFDYHTDGLWYDFRIGQTLTFVFSQEGKLWGGDEIIPNNNPMF